MIDGMSTARPLRARAVLGLAALAALWLLASAFVGAQQASAASGGWKCRASLARVHVRGLGNVEPVVANGPVNNGCIDDFQGARDINLGTGGGAGKIVIDSPDAQTTIDPLTGVAPGAQTATAQTNAAGLRLEDSTGHVVLGLDAISSQQSIHCDSNGQVAPFNGSSDVANLTLNGQQISPDGTLTMIGNGVNGLPNNSVLNVHFDEVTNTTAGGAHYVTRRAVHIELLKDPTKGPLVDIVLGESRVGWWGDVCNALPPTPPHRWTCRASVARVSLANGFADLEPVVANKPLGNNCRTDKQGLNTLTLGNDNLGTLKIGALQAATAVTPPGHKYPASEQQADAVAKAADVEIDNPDGSTLLRIQAINSASHAQCTNGVPTFTGDSTVVGLNINGNEVSPDSTFEQVGDGLNGTPLGDLLVVSFNESEHSGNDTSKFESQTQRAVHIQLFPNATKAGTPLIDVALGETTVGRKRTVC
jgi:hypothetical protein